MRIDAYLQDDGNVDVIERQTYSFDGKFNGITRAPIAKKGTKITDVQAREDRKALKVEQDNGEYKIYRSGKDEQVTIELTYTIENGVEIYTDATQFQWPFFDSNNQSD